VFLPPFRLDHSWSIHSVIGWFEELETYVRVDETDGVSKLFLRGDIRITGSVEIEPAKIVAAIKRGALRPRSSELGYYVTNAGTELPLVYYGCAFVDIPAVEGLAPVSLARTRTSAPHKITDLTAPPEGTATMDPDKLARLATLRAATTLSDEETVERDELEAEADAAGVEVPDEEPAGGEPDPNPADDDATAEDAGDATEVEAGEESDAVREELEEAAAGDDDLVDEPGPDDDSSSDDDAVEVEEDPEPAPPVAGGDEADELRRLRAEVATLRSEQTTREIARFRTAGVIVAANETAATTLLSHDDEGVRRAAATLLENVPSTVVLDRRRGRTSLSSEGNGSGEAGTVIRLGMTADEVGDLWSSLTPEQRIEHRDEYDAWRLDRRENGVRD
jgi:hypothetical protein